MSLSINQIRRFEWPVKACFLLITAVCFAGLATLAKSSPATSRTIPNAVLTRLDDISAQISYRDRDDRVIVIDLIVDDKTRKGDIRTGDTVVVTFVDKGKQHIVQSIKLYVPTETTPVPGGELGGVAGVDGNSYPPVQGGGGGRNPEVGGAAMYANKNIIQNAVNSPINRTLVAAVKAAGLVDTLSGPGPFTVFAPTDDAFGKLPAGTVDTLVKPENKDTLVKILTYHVVPGKITSKQLEKLIKKSGGMVRLKTVQGEDLSASMSGSNIVLTDAKGGTSTITTADIMQSNGVIHVIDTVLMP
ncbi:fasciclin domain-containing protein [Granulicella aggregans]|uniref:fasciclin domain-containing protein n=1 Tax=Granulicella aggregans TaxID=474949 RepID=UPI0021E0C491|nr:fasciclin domain-containing protein [Granulicella aggregans]